MHEEISFVIPKAQAANFGGFFEALDARLDDYDIRSYGVSMSNLEDVFLKINQEFAPDLFGDLKSFEDSKNSSFDSNGKQGDETYPKSIGHSTVDRHSKKGKSELEGNNSQESGSENSSEVGSKDFEIDPEDSTNLIRGSSCVRSCTASSAKRFVIYKRDVCGLLC